jgi:hypothetical protein
MSQSAVDFSTYDRQPISEDTYCLILKDLEGKLAENTQLLRFHERDLKNDSEREVIRLMDSNAFYDPETFTIWTFERFDSSAILTLKFLKKKNRKEINVNTKTFDLSKWQTLTTQIMDSAFWQVAANPQLDPMSAIHDGPINHGEFLSNGNYTQFWRAISVISEYFHYLMNDVWDADCKTASR